MQGRVDAAGYQDFLTKFRQDLETTMSRVEPTRENAILHSRILTRLGDAKQAEAALAPALERDPDDLTVRTALSQARYDQKDYPAALAEANAVLARDPANKEALALKHSSEGRIRSGDGVTRASVSGIADGKTPDVAAVRTGSPAVAGSPEAQALVAKILDARAGGDMSSALDLARELMRTDPTAEYAQNIYRGAASDYARARRGSGAVGDLVRVEGAGSRKEETPPGGGGIPLWPLLPAVGLGSAAYAVNKSRKTVESEDGFNEDERPQPGELQRFVAGSILAGLAGAGLYLGGAMVIGAATPLAARFMAGPGQQAMRLARAETGSINPRPIEAAQGTTFEAKVAGEEAAEIIRRVVIKKGEILNRVWHSEATPASRGLSGPVGASYCRGSCLPINAASALQRRGLGEIPGPAVNNAEQGALFRAKEDIIVVVRKAIGGVEEEIVLQRADFNKLELVTESVSKIPPGR